MHVFEITLLAIPATNPGQQRSRQLPIMMLKTFVTLYLVGFTAAQTNNVNLQFFGESM